jgi:GNAT superfamily N-acetyltransferase
MEDWLVWHSYELHIVESWRNFGHGERLLRALEGFGRNVGVGKAMFTVFAENTEAIRFYRRIGFVLFFFLDWVESCRHLWRIFADPPLHTTKAFGAPQSPWRAITDSRRLNAG